MIAHLLELIFGDEEAVLHGIHAAFDGILNAIRAGGVGERLFAVTLGGRHKGANFINRHLRRRSDAAFLEVDDSAHQQLDSIRAVGEFINSPQMTQKLTAEGSQAAERMTPQELKTAFGREYEEVERQVKRLNVKVY